MTETLVQGVTSATKRKGSHMFDPFVYAILHLFFYKIITENIIFSSFVQTGSLNALFALLMMF